MNAFISSTYDVTATKSDISAVFDASRRNFSMVTRLTFHGVLDVRRVVFGGHQISRDSVARSFLHSARVLMNGR